MNRTLVVWAVLLGAFTLLYQLGAEQRGPETLVPVLLVVLFGLILFLRRRARSDTAKLVTAALALQRGRALDAISAYEPLRSGNSSWAEYGTANAQFMLWRLDDARASLLRARNATRGEALEVDLAPAQMLNAALRNDRASFDVAEQRASALGVGEFAVSHLARAIWLARKGTWSDVLRDTQLAHTRHLGGQTRAIADALRAWSREEAGLGAEPVDLVGILGETGPESVRRYWPEFAAFLERSAARQSSPA